MKLHRAATGAKRPARRPSRRPHPDDAAIEARISAGEDPETFLCVECFCWMLEPAYLGGCPVDWPTAS